MNLPPPIHPFKPHLYILSINCNIENKLINKIPLHLLVDGSLVDIWPVRGADCNPFKYITNDWPRGVLNYFMVPSFFPPG